MLSLVAGKWAEQGLRAWLGRTLRGAGGGMWKGQVGTVPWVLLALSSTSLTCLGGGNLTLNYDFLSTY